MTDQTRPMDAERLAEIRQRAEAVLAETRLGALPARGFIRKYIPDLLAEVARLSAEGDQLKRNFEVVAEMREDEKADAGRLRAVIEEARALAVSDHDMDTRQELAAQFLAILDRGLKGAGE